MNLNFTPRTQQTLALARMDSEKSGCGYVGTEHILMALFKTNGVGKQILDDIGADREKAAAAWARIRNQEEIKALKARIAELEGK